MNTWIYNLCVNEWECNIWQFVLITNKLMSVFNVSLVIGNEFRHNNVKVVCRSTRLSSRGSIAILTMLWMNVYFYTAHITWCLMAVYNAIEWDRTSACEGASGCRYVMTKFMINNRTDMWKTDVNLLIRAIYKKKLEIMWHSSGN